MFFKKKCKQTATRAVIVCSTFRLGDHSTCCHMFVLDGCGIECANLSAWFMFFKKKNANKQQPGLWLFVQVSAWLTILRVGIRMIWMGVVLNVQGVNLSAWFVFSLFQTYLSVWQGDADVQGTGKWWSCRGDMLLWFCYGSCPRDEWSTLPSTTCVAVADRHDFDRVSFSSFFY